MGIQNLLPNIASIAIDRHLSDYAGLTVAVDGYSWLHKASTCCARDLCLNASAGIDKLVRSVLKKIELLRRHRVEPYMVFDGAPLPAKAGTEIKRAADRARHLQRANELAAHGDATQANLYYQKAVDISPHMAHALCQRLRELNVRFVVAPFEADAQLAYMIHEKLVDAIFTEDSDLLAYNSARVFFKLDADGSGKEVSIQNLTQCSELKYAFDLSISNFRGS
jgi:exonuclease-1